MERGVSVIFQRIGYDARNTMHKIECIEYNAQNAIHVILIYRIDCIWHDKMHGVQCKEYNA